VTTAQVETIAMGVLALFWAGVGIATRRTRSQWRYIAWLGVVLCLTLGWFTLHGRVFTGV
jgi:hypothetical protein